MADENSGFGIGNFLSTLTESITAQAATDTQLAETAARENKIVADSAMLYNREAQLAKQEFDAIQAKGADARRKANSNNIFDRVELMGDQILDPGGYTAEGRSKQISEISQGLAMQGQIHSIASEASRARIMEAQANREVQTVKNNLGVNLLKGQVEAQQLAAQGLLAAESVKQQTLLQFDINTLNEALMGPPGKTGRIALNGIEYTPTELRERSNALTNRSQISMLSPMANDPEFAQKKNVQHTMELATMNVAELESLRQNKYIMPDGSTVLPGTWDSAYVRQNTLIMDDMNKRLTKQNVENAVPGMLLENQSLIERTQKWATPGTPLDMAKKRLQISMEGVASLDKEAAGMPPEYKQAKLSQLMEEQSRYVNTMKTEATRRAAGDAELGNLYFKQMVGEPIETEEVAGVMRNRYINRKTMGDVLPPEVTDQVRRLADTNIAKIQMEQRQNQFGLDYEKKNDKMIREEAFNAAFDTVRAQKGHEVANQIDKDLAARKDNPAVMAGVPPVMIEQMQRNAEQAAQSKFLEMTKLTQEQFIYLKSGNAEGAKVSPEQASVMTKQYNLLESEFMYNQLDKHKMGLGYEVQQWTAQEASKLTDAYIERMDPIISSTVGESLRFEVQSRNDDRLRADQSAAERVQKEFTELSTGAKRPENSWMLMLNMNKNLEESQKQTLYYDVLAPVMKSARAAGMNDEQTNEAAFQALNEYESNDKVLMSSVKMLQRDLPNIITGFQQQWDAAMAVNKWNPIWSPGNGSRFFGGGMEGNAAATQLKQAIPWAR